MKREKRKMLPAAALIALLASVIVYLIMLNIEVQTLKNYEKVEIIVASQNIAEGILITEENVTEYFVLKEIDKALLPEKGITDLKELEGQMISVPIDAGSMITKGMVSDMIGRINGMKQPVVAGFKAEDLYQVVSGTLRSGDQIHIYTADTETGSLRLLWEDVFVQEVFDHSGGKIPPQDHTMAAQRVNILLEKDCVEQFYAELTTGTLRVVKSVKRERIWE